MIALYIVFVVFLYANLPFAKSYIFDALKHESQVSFVMTMICRDEAVNFRSNLALWLPAVDYFVFLIDKRTSDGSEAVIESILGNGKSKGYKIIPHDFLGFGQSRTASLDEAWKYFPQATHVVIADPDWKPDPSTMIDKKPFLVNVEVFRYIVYDRNKFTRRRMDWLMRHRKGLSMRYSLHEVNFIY